MGYPNQGRKSGAQAQRATEQLEAIVGDRRQSGGALEGVRRGDIPMFNLKSVHVSAAPTKDDFNKLVDDVTLMAELLRALRG